MESKLLLKLTQKECVLCVCNPSTTTSRDADHGTSELRKTYKLLVAWEVINMCSHTRQHGRIDCGLFAKDLGEYSFLIIKSIVSFLSSRDLVESSALIIRSIVCQFGCFMFCM